MAQQESKPAYIANHSASVLSSHKWRTAANSAAYLIPHLRPNMTILDVGCGPGTITVDLARLIPQGHITGLEYSADPLPGARELASSQAIDNITFTTGDVHALQYADDTFDVVHAHQVLQHLRDPVAALREMRRVVKPDGIVAVRETAEMLFYPRLSELVDFQRLYRQVAEGRGANPHAGDRIHVWARLAGWPRDRVVCSSSTWCYASEAEREWWGGLWQGRLGQGEEFAKVALEDGRCSREDLDRMVRAWGKWKDDQDGWFTVVNGEILCRK